MTNPASPRLNTEDPATRRPELLAPAGDFEAMKAAVANGADAVYFGLSNFNARYRAANFELQDLPGVMEFLHSQNTRGFVTLNTLIFSDELEQVVDFIKACADAGVDAVIVQDLGLTQLIRAIVPELHVHASTQMTLTEPRAIAFAKDLGVRRAVLARELSVKEISLITAKAVLPVEVFIHGALCVSYSGQCLTSESLGGRSANRGQCAQACRLPYDLVVDSVIRDSGDQRYLLSPQDLAGHALVKDLIDIGVVSLKIEGRLKAPDYVAASTQTYRAALDAATHGQAYRATGRQQLDLQQSFSRGFTPGFLDGVNHQRLVPARFPKSRGIKVGTVYAKSHRGVIIALDPQNLALASEPIPASSTPSSTQDTGRKTQDASPLLKPGDGIVFDLSRPGDNEPGGRVYAVHPNNRRFPSPPGQTLVEIDLGRDSTANLDQIPVGAIVWKTNDPESRIRLEQSFARDQVYRQAPITATLVAKVGQPISLTFEDSLGAKSHAASEAPAQEARNQPITHAVAFEQIARLGDTPFELASLTLVGDDNLPPGASKAMVPKSVLNELRRQAAAALAQKCQTRAIHPIVNPNPLPALREQIKSTGGLHVGSALQTGVLPVTHTDHPRLHVMVRSLAQLDAALAWRGSNLPAHLERPATIYADFEDIRQYKSAVQKARDVGVTLGLSTIRIIKPHEEGLLKQIKDCQPDMVLARNLAAISFFKEHAPSVPLVADYSLNIANELTAGILRAMGVVRMVPSYDLNFRQLQAMIARTEAGVYEAVVHQHMPMFHTEHCVFAAMLSKGKDFHDCGRPCEAHKVSLRDRVGQEHPVIPDVGCRNTVYNAQAQSAADYLPRFLAMGVRNFRAELLIENAEQTGLVLQQYAQLLAGTPDAPGQLKRSLSVLSQLGVTAGTLERE